MTPSIVIFWKVALFTRAWIEITRIRGLLVSLMVALFTRAWIEMGSGSV